MSDRREERRKYERDVVYEVWRSGGNPDLLSDERVSNAFWDGLDAESCARSEICRQRPKPSAEEQFPEEQFPEEQFPPEEFPAEEPSPR